MTRSHLIGAALATALLATACGGTDPTAPRDVRSLDAADAPSNVTSERDSDAPSRGLPCDVQLDLDDPPAFGLCGAATDNYKASYNEDPDAPERRTWLAIHQLEVDGHRWQPVAGAPALSDEVEVERVDGEPGTMRVRAEILDGPGDGARIRVGPQRGLWGVLVTIGSADALRDEALLVRLAADDGTEPKLVDVEYRHDPTLADAPRDSLEHNGPEGRWVVSGIATATNLELGWE